MWVFFLLPVKMTLKDLLFSTFLHFFFSLVFHVLWQKQTSVVVGSVTYLQDRFGLASGTHKMYVIDKILDRTAIFKPAKVLLLHKWSSSPLYP